MIKILTDIYLCTMPFLSTDYSNVIDFESRESRNEYFNKRILKTVQSNIKYDGMREYLQLEISISEMRDYDYLFFWNEDNKKFYYYFIVNCETKKSTITNVYIELDVWTTYQNVYSILPSFVERCHVIRWNGDKPTNHNKDEGLEKGEIIQIDNPLEIATMEKTVVIATSVPIGYVPKPDNTGGIGGTGTMWLDGKISSKCFRFIKGMEGFAPSKYQDSGGYWTISYGITLHGESTVYNSLVAKSPISEEEGAKASYELKNKNYGAKILETVRSLGCNTQNQFDALTSLAYNGGVGSVTGDNTLTRAIELDPNNESVIRPIWESFKVTSNGIALEGLRILRQNQCNMYFGQEFEIRDIPLINSSGGISGTVTENGGDGWLPQDYENGSDEEGDYNGYKSFSNDFGSGWLCPVKGATVSSKYGWRVHPISGTRKFHHGTDLGKAKGSPTVASKSGTITRIGFDNSMGNFIYLDTSSGHRIKYMHLSKINVAEGETVTRGQVVGLIGSTGSSTGAHCHWEIREIESNESTDPSPSLNKGDKV